MQSPLPTLALCIFYAYFSRSLAPRWMENRKPFGLRRTLICYNLFQTVFSAWIFYEVSETHLATPSTAHWHNLFQYLQSGWLRDYSYRCQPVDYTPKGLRMAETCWWYYISKFTEFFDTMFFLLRKKNQQVSTLHVIHHGVMPFSGKCDLQIGVMSTLLIADPNHHHINFSVDGNEICPRRP